MRWIRWKAVIPLAIFLGVLAIVIIVFLDPFLKWATIRGGEAVFGAKVEINSFKTRFKDSSMRLGGVQIADKSEPMKNLIQFDELVFDLQFLPLLEKKVIIDNASWKGIRFGTPRKTSGALPLTSKRPGFVGKAVDRLWSQVESATLGKFEGLKKYTDPKTIINKENLQAVKAAEDAKKTIESMPEDLKARVDALKAPERAADLRARAEALKSKVSGAGDVLEKVNSLRAIQSDLQKLRSDILNTQKDVTDKIRSAEGLVQNVVKAKDEDWNRLLKLLELPSFDKDSIVRLIFGPKVMANVEKLLNGVQTARQYMPAKAAEPPPPPRGVGRTIEFPRHTVLPRFLLVKGELSGEVGQDKPFGFNGTLSDIASNPTLWGKPAMMKLSGTQGPRSFFGEVVVDHRAGRNQESVEAKYNGFSLASLDFGQKQLGVLLKEGAGRVAGRIVFNEDSLDGQAQFGAEALTLEPRIDLGSSSDIAQRVSQSITTSLSKVRQLTLGVRLSGKLAAPDLQIQSNLGDVVAGAMKAALGQEIEHQTQALRAELDKQVSAHLDQLKGQTEALRAKYLQPLAGQNQYVDQLLADVTRQISAPLGGAAAGKPAEALQKGTDALKGLFNKK